jgi:hypothetical protein
LASVPNVIELFSIGGRVVTYVAGLRFQCFSEETFIGFISYTVTKGIFEGATTLHVLPNNALIVVLRMLRGIINV